MGTARTGETTSATDALTGVAKAASGVRLAYTADGVGVAVGVVVESMGTARTGETTSATDALTGVAKAASGVGLASTADGVGVAVGVGVGNWVGACTTGSGSAQAVSNARAIMTTIPIRDLLEIIIRVFVWHNLFARRRRELGSQVVEVTGVRRRQNRTIKCPRDESASRPVRRTCHARRPTCQCPGGLPQTC